MLSDQGFHELGEFDLCFSQIGRQSEEFLQDLKTSSCANQPDAAEQREIDKAALTAS